MNAFDPYTLLQRGRTIQGMAAVLLPFDQTQRIDLEAFHGLLERTITAGLIPAVNMDTGYVNLLEEGEKQLILAEARDHLQGKPFVAGAFVKDKPGDQFNLDDYRRAIEQIQTQGGLPIIFPSYGLGSLNESELIDAYRRIAELAPRFLAFELSPLFAPFGRIYILEVYADLMRIPQCIGAKHSSLSRQLEWQRLELRNRVRPEFRVLTGNDLAIDMVMYGSDYLLGLASFAPDLFALRDRYWQMNDSRFFELNDQLQYLGAFAFRKPISSYKHSAAQFLALRGWIKSDQPPPAALRRPECDLLILKEMLDVLSIHMEKN